MKKLLIILIIVCAAGIGARVYLTRLPVREPADSAPEDALSSGGAGQYGGPLTAGRPLDFGDPYFAIRSIDSGFAKRRPGLLEQLRSYARAQSRLSPVMRRPAKRFRPKTGRESLLEFLRAYEPPLDDIEPVTGFSMPLQTGGDPMLASFREYREAVRKERRYEEYVEKARKKREAEEKRFRERVEEMAIKSRMEVPDTAFTLPADPEPGARAAYLRRIASDNPLPHLGGSVFMGSWPQSGGKPEPVEWLVVEKFSDRAVCVISKYVLDAKAFCDGKDMADSWSGSTLRSWLNGEFFDKAFSAAEKRRILDAAVHDAGRTLVRDKVFIPCDEEVKAIFGNNIRKRVCAPTAYAKEAGVYLFEGSEYAWWWTKGNSLVIHSCINHEGFTQPVYARAYTVGVRPMMWIRPE